MNATVHEHDRVGGDSLDHNLAGGGIDWMSGATNDWRASGEKSTAAE
jgi:hypothetical protein